MGSKALQRLLCLCFLSILSSSHAHADTLPVGSLSFDLLQTGSSGSLFGLDVFNGTQAGGGSPVFTFVNFTSLNLNVTLSGGGTLNVVLSPTDAFGDFSTGAIFSAGTLLSATLTGSFSPTTVTLSDGTVVTINPSLSAVLTGVSGGPLQGGDLVAINATTIVQGVPEPSTLLLLGLPLFLLAYRVRAGLRLHAYERYV